MSKHYRKDSRFVSVVTVRVSSLSGLMDMLRYDRCCPFSEEDSSKLSKINGWEQCGGLPPTPLDRVVRLLRFSANELPATAGRWRSFNCEVLDERQPGDDSLDLTTLVAQLETKRKK